MQRYRVMIDPQGLEYNVPNDMILDTLRDPENKLVFKTKTVYFINKIDPTKEKCFSSKNVNEIVSLLSSDQWMFGASNLRKDRYREKKSTKQLLQRKQFEKMQLNLFTQNPQGETPVTIAKTTEQPKVLQQSEKTQAQDNISLMLIKTLLSGSDAKIENLKLEVSGTTIEFSCNIKN